MTSISPLSPFALTAIPFRMKFFRKTEVWRPTRWGLVLILLLCVLFGTGLFFRLYPFLAQNAPLPQTELVIIEGWLEDTALAQVVAEAGSNVLFITTGGPIKLGASLLKEKTYAEVTTARLHKLGVSSVLTAAAPDTSKDRTYASALAVRRLLEERGLLGCSANLYSLGAHSRRSFLLYRLAFGPEVPLGVVALESEECNLHHWWSSSPAFKHVLSELTSWFYLLCTRWKY